jgi:hypothetical protein
VFGHHPNSLRKIKIRPGAGKEKKEGNKDHCQFNVFPRPPTTLSDMPQARSDKIFTILQEIDL